LVIIKKLEDIVFGKNEKQNLAIAIPPRTGKSAMVKYFVAWTYAVNRNCQNIYTSYSDKLIQKFSGEIRDIINSPLYQELFGIEIEQDTNAKSLWKIKNGGGLVASSLGGTLTGFGAGGLGDNYCGGVFIDDPLKADNYKSNIERENCIDFYVSTLKSRRERLDKTPIILIMQRLHKNDLIGWIEENESEDWDFVKLPALKDDGTSIFPEKIPIEYLEQMKDTKPYVFYSQYQQEPIILGGGVIKHTWWQYYQDFEINYKKIFITGDTAMKTNEWNDYTAIGVWGLGQDNKLRLLDMVHGKFEAPELESTLLGLWNKWKNGIGNRHTSAVYIEDKASGTGLIQSLKRKGGLPIVGVIPDKDKLERVYDCVGYISSGNVLLPQNENNPISKVVLAEADSFSADMSHEHDDIVDMITMAINQAYNQRGLF
jgi:predicted phage terminase large subunit-like protein